MNKALSILGFVLALAIYGAPLVAGSQMGISIPWLADPQGTTILPSGVVLHVSYTVLGHVCILVGTLASLCMSLVLLRAFSP